VTSHPWFGTLSTLVGLFRLFFKLFQKPLLRLMAVCLAACARDARTARKVSAVLHLPGYVALRYLVDYVFSVKLPDAAHFDAASVRSRRRASKHNNKKQQKERKENEKKTD